jgi:D-alanyl-lipoteichoic acid acyltransferase DltB (MBOAT superfamily)
LIASCIFYIAFIPIYIFILFFTIIIDYFAGIFIARSSGHTRKWWLVASLISNIGVLALFKYYNFIIENVNEFLHVSHLCNSSFSFLGIALPIGLSFHTFQAMSYTIEVYRGNQKPEKHFGIYALYVMFYPQLVAGPIERPQHIFPQLYEKHDPDSSMIGSGLRLMAWGFFKKMVIADHLALYVDKVFEHPGNFPGFPSLTAVIFFSFQIYCDFSAYSDIARGAARVMGFSLMRNFNFPYFSKSIREFWTRWHISLSSWFRDYLYISMGGNRLGFARWCFNILIVFLISGLWHGANWTFVIWGGLHGFFMLAGILKNRFSNKYLNKLRLQIPGFLNTLTVFCLVSFGWIFFRSKNLPMAIETIRACTSQYNFRHPGFTTSIVNRVDFTISLVSLGILLSVETFQFQFSGYQKFIEWNSKLRLACYILLCLLIVTFGIFNNNKFIYFQF